MIKVNKQPEQSVYLGNPKKLCKKLQLVFNPQLPRYLGDVVDVLDWPIAVDQREDKQSSNGAQGHRGWRW